MKRQYSGIFGLVFLVLGIVGLVVRGQILEIINSDIAVDIIRLALSALLLFAAYSKISYRGTGIILSSIGVFEMVVGLISVVDDQLLGLAPSSFTAFDMAFHIIAGLITFVIGWNHILPRTGVPQEIDV